MQSIASRGRTVAINLLLLPFFLFLLSGSQVTGQTTKTYEEQQIEIGLKPDEETIMLGEPVFLAFEVKNLLAQDLCLGVGGDYRNNLGRPDSFKVSVTGKDGKAVPQPEAKGFGGFSGCAQIPANGNYVVKLFLPHWATFTETGSYTINVRRRMAFFNYQPKHTTFPDPDIVLQADVSAHINVAPYDEERMGEVIRSLGEVMLDITNPAARDSAQALAHIGDRRAIKYFARALEQFGEAEFADFTEKYLISSRAVSALAQFDDDSAIEALEAVMWSPSNDTRLDVASALVSSKHPKAIGLLLKMRNDSYWFVRLRVAQGLSKVKSADATALLREMLADENEEVRKAARDGLKTSG
jgi:hypothetical protein